MSQRWSIVRALVVAAALLGLSACTGSGGADVGGASAYLAPPTAFDVYDIDWVREDDGSRVIRTSRHIDAPPDVVWDLVSDPNHYRDWSNALHAFVLGRPAAGKTVVLSTLLFPNAPRVVTFEKIETFDDAHMGVSWYADFGSGGRVLRWQVVVPEGTGSRYYTAEKIPNTLIGTTILLLTGAQIQALFNTIANELEAEAESLAL